MGEHHHLEGGVSYTPDNKYPFRKTIMVIVMIAFWAVVLFLLLGCQQSGTQQSGPGMGLNTMEGIRTWTDPGTGCVYYKYYYNLGNASVGSLSVRYRADGKADCPQS